jgi:hypothetical protein
MAWCFVAQVWLGKSGLARLKETKTKVAEWQKRSSAKVPAGTGSGGGRAGNGQATGAAWPQTGFGPARPFCSPPLAIKARGAYVRAARYNIFAPLANVVAGRQYKVSMV